MSFKPTIRHLCCAAVMLCTTFINSQNYPGGVTGAEVWYIVNRSDADQGVFKNSSDTNIELNKCFEGFEPVLFNFNPAIYSDKVCLYFNAPLENSTGRDVFFVGEPNDNEPSFSHLGSEWDPALTGFPTDSVIRNFFDFNNKSFYAWDILDTYSSDKNARVNFYHTNYYNVDKKFKSYGEKGESRLYLGVLTDTGTDEEYQDNDFNGSFPEFISFPRELSMNERHRVESYLALKYGLTLSSDMSYLSSKNIVFWNKENNNIFSNRIFGFGIDAISGLSQFQSESTHLKEHVVAAIGSVAETNRDKIRELGRLDNNHFLVFGDDDGQPLLTRENEKGIKFFGKTWLAERTGSKVSDYPIFFKLYLTELMREYLASNPDETVWFLHDKFIGHDEVSEFDNENIEYTEGTFDLEEGIAYFDDIHFDTDFSVYDQFTFGVGPKIVVQAQLVGCYKEDLEMIIEIDGGKPEYKIIIESLNGLFDDSTNQTTYSYGVDAGVTYEITVEDANGVIFTFDYTPQPWDFSLNLGNTQYLNASQTEIILDAGSGITDPDATYQWYFEGNLLPETGSTLTVDEVGNYEVIVTSGDQSCSISDRVQIEYSSFEAYFVVNNGCGLQENTLDVLVDGGIPPYTTTLNNGNTSVNYPHSSTTTINNVAYGSYQVTITDSTGESFSDGFNIVLPPTNLGIDVYAQLETICGYSCFDYQYSPPLFTYTSDNGPFELDGSVGAYRTDLEYEWVLNGTEIFSTYHIAAFSPEDDCYPSGDPGIPEITLNVYDPSTGCSISQSFLIRTYCPDEHEARQTMNDGSDPRGAEFKINSLVYPNPTEKNNTFIYEVYSGETFGGTVELYSMTGAVLYRIPVADAKNHKLPFKLDSAGVYLIKIITSTGVVKTDRIIIN